MNALSKSVAKALNGYPDATRPLTPANIANWTKFSDQELTQTREELLDSVLVRVRPLLLVALMLGSLILGSLVGSLQPFGPVFRENLSLLGPLGVAVGGLLLFILSMLFAMATASIADYVLYFTSRKLTTALETLEEDENACKEALLLISRHPELLAYRNDRVSQGHKLRYYDFFILQNQAKVLADKAIKDKQAEMFSKLNSLETPPLVIAQPGK